MGKGSQFPHLRHDRDVADFAIFLVAPVKSRLNFVGSCLAPPNRMDTEDPIRVNCGGCGRPMLLTIEALRELKTVDCTDCATIRHLGEARDCGRSESGRTSHSSTRRIQQLFQGDEVVKLPPRN